MAVMGSIDDPQANLKKRLMNRPMAGPVTQTLGEGAYDTPAAPAPAPVAPPAAPPAAPAAPVRTHLGVQTPGNEYTSPGAPIAPGVPAPATPAAPAPAAAPGGGSDQSWLDWIAKTYGTSKSRGAGFADLPQGVSLEQAIGRYNQETGANAKYLGGPSGDRVDFGQGVTDALTSGGQLWSDYGAMSGSARQGASTSTAGAGGAGGGAGGAGGSNFQAQIRAQLLARLAAAGAPVNPTDPNIAEPMAAAQLEASRAQEMERKALAEHAAATGDTSNTINMGIQQSAERNAVGLGGLRAKLIQGEYQTRRQEMTDMLQLATASGDAEAARQIQVQLAELDAAVRREGIGADVGKYEAYLNSQTVNQGLGNG